MSPTVYRINTLLSSALRSVPVGTNLALCHLLWTMLSGRLLASRGALFPALADFGLPAPAVRRAWAALAGGDWQIAPLLTAWRTQVEAEGHWQPRRHGPYRPVVADLVGFFRPRLHACPTTHYSSAAGKPLPAIPLGMLARIGTVGAQRLPLPLALLRADPAVPSERSLSERLIAQAAAFLAPEEVLIVDGGFPPAQLLAAKVPRFVVRGAMNFTARRATLPEARRRGRPPEYGVLVRPLPRQRKGRQIPATPPDRETGFLCQDRLIRVQIWENLVLASAKPGAPIITCYLFHDPRYREPLLLITNLTTDSAIVYALYRDRWPIEQWPLAAKQMIGAARQFVFAGESRQRLPELAMLAGALLSYAAATAPAVATGFWDRQPRATPGRLRRVLAAVHFSELGPLPAAFREKASPTAHLPKGVLGHRRRRRPSADPEPLPLAA